MFTLHLKAIQYRSYSRRRRDQITRHIRIAFRRGSRPGGGTEVHRWTLYDIIIDITLVSSLSFSLPSPWWMKGNWDHIERLESYLTFFFLIRGAMMDEKRSFLHWSIQTSLSKNIYICAINIRKRRNGNPIPTLSWHGCILHIYTWDALLGAKRCALSPSLLFPDSQSNKRTSERVQPSSV